MKILPRFKIQYPMKNRDKSNGYFKRKKFFFTFLYRIICLFYRFPLILLSKPLSLSFSLSVFYLQHHKVR